MPRKGRFNLKTYQGPSSPVSAGSSHHGAGGDSPAASVNERLSELRMTETPEGLQKKRDLAEAVNFKSVPPELRGLLGISESAPPRPKIGFRLRERMRTPGPPPPQSWLGYRPPGIINRRASKAGGGRAEAKYVRLDRPKAILRFQRMVDGQQINEKTEPRGLVHLTMKRLAEQWDLFDEEDYPALVEIPLRLRLRLLSYIGSYGPLIDAATLQALTQGSKELTYLDLASIAGHGTLTMKRLARMFESSSPTTVDGISGNLAEAWDDESLDLSGLHLTVSAFTNLTHLSLSNPPSTASWRDLLALSKHVSQLTHVSLAYWPRPSLTPNLATATIASPHNRDIAAGGSSIYSELDQDYAEPAALLRRLSHNLLCLQWLDLEGCAEWSPALGTLATVERPASSRSWRTRTERPITDDGGSLTTFVTSWKNLSYVNLAQGWMPTLDGVGSLGATANEEIKRALFLRPAMLSTDQWSDPHQVEKRKARIWMDREHRTLTAAKEVNAARRSLQIAGAKPMMFDFGYLKKAV
ncbi:hypothetical protein LTR78_003195 [Recurvomyces mirabilis]|uniref:Tafazzin n=1 Tax=Recurvomyces mirabilis TaxID=574656 RepID=A0AAE0WSV0_9PEZI|nr:hypothetical protein LTR78_003195 [Recurvomyces mirabilis]KAK5156985.1 hypothetical protein LTS14_004502 [Recurvomyces mirabilis]